MPTAHTHIRTRRLRNTPLLRAMVQEHHLRPEHLIYPMFIEENTTVSTPIESMPNISRCAEPHLPKTLKQLYKQGVRSLMLFGVSHTKDAAASDTQTENGLLYRMISTAKKSAPHMCIIADICCCEYTDHGHCGPLCEKTGVDNDETLEILANQAVVSAKAGADMVAPSAMMDGQIQAIRTALDAAGFTHIPIMAYAAKFASSFYGPFRAAAGCDLAGDRKQYQMNPANRREAVSEALIDEVEGADIIMVKPGMPYLDVLREVRDTVQTPVAAYQVSGEYAMLKFAAKAGALDEKRAVLESLLAFRRAGADFILSYYTPQVLVWLNEQN